MHDNSLDVAAQSEFQASLPFRHDTILGVCQGIGEDFGIDPLWIRLGFAAMLFVYPVWTVVAYFAVGLLVVVARLFAPDVGSTASRPHQVVPAALPTEIEEQPELPLAA